MRGVAARLAMGAAMAGGSFTDALAQDAVAPPPAAPEAAASVDGGAGVIPYPASFFAQFRPNNANDMVARLPGFTFNKGDDVRGFGGAAGNVLIDGERPSSKAVGLDQVLQRIPVSQVERIDLVRGGAPGIDMQGQPVVANVIRKKGASATGAIQNLFKPYPDENYFGMVPRIEQTFRSGGFSFEGQLNGRKDIQFDTGQGRLTRRRADGSAFEQGDFDSDVERRVFDGNAAIEHRRQADVFRLNGAFERNDIDRLERADLATVAGAAFRETSRIKTRADSAEIGGDYQRDLAPWLSGQIIGLKTFKQDRLNAFATSRNPSQQSTETSRSGETILRGTLTAVRSEALQFEAGAEGAFNYLDANSALLVGGAPVALPSANVRVEEKRAEGFVTATAKLWTRVSAEAGLRYETSTISQTGGANQKKTLSFPKPRLILSYAPDPLSQIRVRVERTVGQLNFKDFAATAQLDAGTVNAGNPDLEPERAWVGEIALERRFWGQGAVVLTATHQEVQEVVDLIPIDGRFDAPGNIGDGTRDELKVSLTVPLERLGLSNTIVRFNGTWRKSSVTDPVTGQKRRISNQRPFEGDLYIARSFPSLNSTLVFDGAFAWRETAYRIGEVRTTEDVSNLPKIYWDWQARPDLIFRFQVENILSKDRRRERILYTGPRSGGRINFVEKRNAELAPFMMIRARKTW